MVKIELDKRFDAKASIFIIYTGGTLGMGLNQEGALTPLDFEDVLSQLPTLQELRLNLTVISFEPPIDSSNIKVEQWGDIARVIETHYTDFDGFVVLHGTDTMAYSASALSFMLEGLKKPVVFTGAQLPIGSPRSDARENFIGALEIASDYRDGKPMVSEVCIFFNHILIRGNRSKKVESNHFDAFESENYPILAEAGVTIDYDESALAKYNDSAVLNIKTDLNNAIVVLKLFPGINTATIKSILDNSELNGIILESYGSGNVPHEPWFLDLLEEAVRQNKVILNVSQCNGGQVSHGKYQASSQLNRIGVISGRDLTTEAACTKLMFALANYQSFQEVKTFLTTPISGEMA